MCWLDYDDCGYCYLLTSDCDLLNADMLVQCCGCSFALQVEDAVNLLKIKKNKLEIHFFVKKKLIDS
jgi:hypothetical protein